jgi:hypothetical protein
VRKLKDLKRGSGTYIIDDLFGWRP